MSLRQFQVLNLDSQEGHKHFSYAILLLLLDNFVNHEKLSFSWHSGAQNKVLSVKKNIHRSK
jgi:hypothetical protein